ncbi:MAG: peptide ABC transporter substrate-binding protein [Oscillospiraceae bacterium]|nr:peptide ABC transporter substrate-binding protein [Oscillospiraceae bacterium]
MKKLMASVLAAAMVLSLAACGSSASSTASSEAASTTESASSESTAEATGTKLNTDTSAMYLCLASEPEHLDPALNTTVDGACLAVNSFVGLLTYDENGNIVPGVAESYDVSDDKLTYTFHLRDSLWSDGTPVTAGDFVYSWNRAANPLTASDYGYLFDGLIAKNPALDSNADGSYVDEAAANEAMANNDILLNVEAVDDNTLTVTIETPCPYFLSLCAFPTFFPVPQASVEAADPNGENPGAWAAEAGFVCNGAFTCTEWKHDESMVYTKNPNYYDAENVTLETLNFMLSNDEAAFYAAYNAGNLDFIDSVPTDEIPNLKGINPEFQVLDNLGTYYMCFNVNSTLFEGKTPEQANAMRKAINLLVDRQYICDNIGQTDQTPANTFIPPAMSDGNGAEFRQNTADYTYPNADALGYFDPSEDAYDDNVAEAIELLESAGYKFTDDGMLSDETPLSFTYLTNSGAGNEAVAAALQQDMAVIGINVDIQAEDWKVFLNDRKAGNFDVARNGWLADFDDPINMIEMWITNSGNNDVQFGRDPATGKAGTVPSYAPQDWNKYDELVASIKSETDFAKRANMLHEAEDMLMETYAIVPLYYYNDPYMMKSNVSGMYSNAFGYKYFMYCTKTAA